ncbi:MAG TPA: dihydrolipoamide acetyltransferase family protein [Chloroflexia bacterium]|nr:dihydrolipoamide acetyltransferase family protein [Chloroflexia bacterium]
MFEFKLPDVGEGMHEAEILRWLVTPGESVKLDQPMLEIQTDKAVVQIPAPVAGKVQNIYAPVGKIAHVGDLLVSFETADSAREAATVAATPAAAVSRSAAPVTSNPPANPRLVRAAPAVRRRAVELEVDISQVKPSSPDGRILLKDVEAFASLRHSAPVTEAVTSTPAPSNGHSQPEGTNGHVKDKLIQLPEEASPAEERKPLLGLRRRIAERMELSWRTIPHAVAFEEIDGTELVALRQKLLPASEKRGTRLTYLPLIVKAVVQTLKQHPAFNASLNEETREVIYKKYYHIGLATATPDGLLVPVLRQAERLTLFEMAAEISRLAEGGRTRSLKTSELSGSTFTISNVGSYGGRNGVAIINPPEAAILAVGKMEERCVIREGQIQSRPILPLSLSFDHRLNDGAEAGAFMATLKEVLENPSLLLLDL